MSDEFFSTFLLTLNTFLGTMFGCQSLITGEGGEVVYRLTGRNVSLFPVADNNIVRISPGILAVSLTPIGVYLMLQGIDKLAKWIKSHKSNSVSPDVDQNQVQNQGAAGYNNQSRNREVISSCSQAIGIALALAVLVPAVIGVYFFARLDRTLSDLDIAFIDFARIASCCIIVPSVIYARNCRMRDHVSNGMKDFIHNLY